MPKPTALLSLLLSFSFVAGCHNGSPKSPAIDPKAGLNAQPTNEKPDPATKDCAAISDQAQAEDCRLWKGVAAAKKKHSSNNVVKHSPASIQQP